jgi:chemotaxis methyl-accepting protein methylase
LSGVQWQIDACDLNADRLDQARRATYEAGSLRACSDEDRGRLFASEGSRFVLKERYRKGVRFMEANLALPFSGLGAQGYDVILCRNLLIYLGEAAIRALVDRFARLLHPGGLLMLGHAESLIDKSADFAPLVLDGVVVYRRVGPP